MSGTQMRKVQSVVTSDGNSSKQRTEKNDMNKKENPERYVQ
jgi:hypothetical protein